MTHNPLPLQMSILAYSRVRQSTMVNALCSKGKEDQDKQYKQEDGSNLNYIAASFQGRSHSFVENVLLVRAAAARGDSLAG